ncbi:uncharacterized protein LOC125655256 [Ostrea edulis]|uniref:uncharacterized protein LOC125655256 n=1 Tax=Ostrea edulis TaxID=37623 RepID=UPI0024AEA7DA|nr:uncharacterized protein LOC125655256 [Ostrea edulis]XP_048741449.2 uncharacterized protein LOC125655256 [Ostrea edulis]
MQNFNEIIYAVNSLLTLHFACATSPTIYTFGKSCSLHPQQINEDFSFYVAYHGDNKSSDIWCSHIAFSGHGTNSRDKYQICTTPKTYFDPSCRMILTLRNSLNGTALRSYTCEGISMSKFCAKQGEDLYIVVQFFSASKWKREFLFYVDATKMYSHVDMVAGITGGVAGSCIVIFIAVFLLWRKKKLSSPFQRHPFVTFSCGQTHLSEDSNRSSITLEETERQTDSRGSDSSQLPSENLFPSTPCLVINYSFQNVPSTSKENRVTTNLGAPPPYEASADASLNPPDYSSLYM